jgi:hypothetical protein
VGLDDGMEVGIGVGASDGTELGWKVVGSGLGE